MDNKFSIGGILIAIFFSVLAAYICLTFKPVERKINHWYHVYLGGEKIGLTYSKDELYELID